MIEVALVFDMEGHAIFWPSPKGNSPSGIDDSRILWERLWDCRKKLEGVAHTHPWNGTPFPSPTDETTWWAIERALGKNFTWPIVSMDDVKFFRRFPREGGHHYQAVNFKPKFTTHWMENIIEMRRLSRGG